MDLTKLSDADLMALQSGDMSKLSDEALQHLSQQTQQENITQPKDGSKGVISSIIDYNSPKNLGNLVAGGVRGAGSIGATLLAPYDIAKDALNGKGLSLESNRERRSAMDGGLQAIGADTDSGLYATGKLGGEIAGTAGVGDALAIGAKALPYGQKLANAISSGGLNIGTTAQKALSLEGLGNGLTRLAGGAINGGVQAGMVNPDEALKGAEFGAVLPVGVKAFGELGNAFNAGTSKLGNYLMQSALKPTIEQRRSGEADRAIKTLFDEGLNATKGGVEELQSRVGNINDNIKNIISNSSKTIDKQAVIDALTGTRSKFANQVSPTSDLNAIQGVADDFVSHPSIAGQQIPVQQAQSLKQGTYSVLKGKFGETGSASTEAQKSLARGLKDQIALAHPEVGAMNKRESDLLNALSVTERRALLDANKNPVGLAGLASNPVAAAGMLADRSALVKSLLARGTNKLSKESKNAKLAQQLIEQASPKLIGAYAAD